ncbi:MAG: response regulator [Chitinophagaceae bacterium]|nr:MAG: response regulator [Chitinophagaceae bacterium]
MGNVLIIDDELDICFLLSKIIQKKGWEVDFENNLTNGIKKIKEKKYDFIFLDLNLPDGYGMNFITLIKNHQPDSKIILISAYDSDEERNTAQLKGADSFMGKPFSEVQVANILKPASA